MKLVIPRGYEVRERSMKFLEDDMPTFILKGVDGGARYFVYCPHCKDYSIYLVNKLHRFERYGIFMPDNYIYTCKECNREFGIEIISGVGNRIVEEVVQTVMEYICAAKYE